MRVCLDVSPAAHQQAGIARYCVKIVTHLLEARSQDSFVLLYNSPGAQPLPQPLARLPAIRVPLPTRPWRLGQALGHLSNALWFDRWLGNVDLFHGLDHTLPPLRRIPGVVTIHDLSYHLFPQHHLPLNRLYLRLMVPIALRRAARIIAVSESVRGELVQRMGVAPERVVAVPHGVDAPFQPQPLAMAQVIAKRLGIIAPYILTTGTIEPRKNLALLLQAYERLCARGDVPHHLVVVGQTGWLAQPFFDALQRAALVDRVHLLGYVPDETLAALYAGADAFVFPSFYEGFGLPALEAMACGAPVLASDITALREVVGDAGLFFDPRDEEELAATLQRVLNDQSLRQALVQRGLVRARQFTWQQAARLTAEVYESALESAAVGRSTST